MNNYWILYNLIDGSIYGAPYLGNATEWINIPIGCAVLGPFEEEVASAIVKDAWFHPNYYLVQAGALVAKANILDLQLVDSKMAKVAEISNAYKVQLNSNFTSSATGTSLIYSFSPESQSLWEELLNSITANYIPDTMFPMPITLLNGTKVTHTKLQLQQIFGEITVRKLLLYGKLQGMVAVGGSIQAATTIDAVNLVVW